MGRFESKSGGEPDNLRRVSLRACQGAFVKLLFETPGIQGVREAFR